MIERSLFKFNVIIQTLIMFNSIIKRSIRVTNVNVILRKNIAITTCTIDRSMYMCKHMKKRTRTFVLGTKQLLKGLNFK